MKIFRLSTLDPPVVLCFLNLSLLLKLKIAVPFSTGDLEPHLPHAKISAKIHLSSEPSHSLHGHMSRFCYILQRPHSSATCHQSTLPLVLLSIGCCLSMYLAEYILLDCYKLLSLRTHVSLLLG